MIEINQKENLEPFKVYIRIRPFLPKEFNKIKKHYSFSSPTLNYNNITNSKPESYIKINQNHKSLFLEDIKYHRNNKTYSFNKIFTEEYSNKQIFNSSIKPIIDNFYNGYNSTVLAYGASGTGKTHTIFGELSSLNGEEGIIINAINYLFEKISFNKNKNEQHIIKVSYIEIYNENVIDLFSEKSSYLMITEDPENGVYVPNVKEYQIYNINDLKKIINDGNKKRTMASTNQNQFSSRSHAVLQISLEIQKLKNVLKKTNEYEIIISKLLMVDLAGSEKYSENGKRREEGCNINKSLFTLGNCINILSDKSKWGNFVPYRDSKLTRLLKDSLGGNILTVFLCCISPSKLCYEETLKSLNYAANAKKIKKKVYKNNRQIFINNKNENNQYEDIIYSLKSEISNLKNIIKTQESRLNEKNTFNSNNTTIYEENENKENKKNYNNIVNLDINTIPISLGKFFQSNNNDSIENEDSNLSKLIDKDNDNIINNEINYNIYEDFLMKCKDNNNLDLDYFEKIINNIKKTKKALEIFFYYTKSNSYNKINLQKQIQKYILIKNYYNKFIEAINDKLLENIEQNLILKSNIKEINELNKSNINDLNILKSKKNNFSCNKIALINEIHNIEKAINENTTLKNNIIESFNNNINEKKNLKKILLCLLTDNMKHLIMK